MFQKLEKILLSLLNWFYSDLDKRAAVLQLLTGIFEKSQDSDNNNEVYKEYLITQLPNVISNLKDFNTFPLLSHLEKQTFLQVIIVSCVGSNSRLLLQHFTAFISAMLDNFDIDLT